MLFDTIFLVAVFDPNRFFGRVILHTPPQKVEGNILIAEKMGIRALLCQQISRDCRCSHHSNIAISCTCSRTHWGVPGVGRKEVVELSLHFSCRNLFHPLLPRAPCHTLFLFLLFRDNPRKRPPT